MNPATSSKTSGTIAITPTMRVSDILALLPNAAPQLAEYGLSCFSCAANEFETLEEGCASHGFSQDVINDLVTDLNILLQERPARPQELTITQPAAAALKEMLKTEGKEGWILQVGLDVNGGFSLEFAEKLQTQDRVFSNKDVPDLQVAASAVTLAGIGGSTIDLRDGRFKLDLPEDAQQTGGCACKNGGTCGC